jgi:uncharacterized protein
MHQQIPKEIDPFRFAHQGRELEGEMSLSDMPRLASLLHSSEGSVRVYMAFDVDELGTPFMKGHFETTLMLTCERCMQAMAQPVDIEPWLGMIKHEKLAESLSDQYEPWVIEDAEMILPVEIVEDELILSLPIVAKHKEQCLPEELWTSGETEKVEQIEKKVSPFSVLADLKIKK